MNKIWHVAGMYFTYIIYIRFYFNTQFFGLDRILKEQRKNE